jgi:flagellin
MSLGVLNNLNAIYAENNLNNTNNSLSTVLNQLSSGSKINSGADDAAGLSLVDGLEANSVALAQSKTNASEGVGLLTVADGALSQVTNLLNRAVTLATEASNGTLNSSQDTAANQEYQSILSEVNNIGATTTYNNQAVFNTRTDIYTGDSSATGSSIDALNIASLSSSNLGDTGGIMAYSNGQNSVFVNLSNGTQNAQSTDTLNQSGNTTINVNYLVKGADGAETAASTSISVGGNSGYQNTAAGLVSAINGAGLGLSASFTTEAQAGVVGGGTQTGIQITGGAVSVGVDPNAASTSGILNPAGITTQDFALGQTITVTAGGTTAASFVIDSSTNTLDTLANAITAGTGHGLNAESVTASVITNGNGSQSIALSDATGGGALSVTVSGGQSAFNLSNPTSAAPATSTSLTFSSGTAGAAATGFQAGGAGTPATGTLAFTSGYSATSATALTGTIVLSNGAGNQTFTMGGNAGTTLGSLAAEVGTVLGVSTSITSSGFTMTSLTNAANTIGMASNSLATTVAVNNGNVVDGQNATIGSDGTTTLSMVNGNGYGYNSSAPTSFNLNDALANGTSLVLTNGNADAPGTATTFVIGAASSSGHTIAVGASNTNSDINTLITAITTGTGLADTGINNVAINGSGQLVFTSANVGTTITVGGSSNLADVQNLSVAQNTQTSANNQSAGGNVTVALSSLTSNTANVLGGSVVINNGEGGAAQTFVMGAGAHNGALNGGAEGWSDGGANANTWTVNGNSMADLTAAINLDSADLGITATDNSGSGKGITLAMGGTAYGSSISVNSTSLTDNYATSLLNPVASGGSGTSGTLAMTANGTAAVAMAGSALTGTLVLANTVGGTTTVTDTFVMGSNGSLAGTNNTWDVSGNTVGALMAAINAAGTYSVSSGKLNVTATADGTSGGIKIQSIGTTDTNLSMAGSALTANVTEANTTGTQGQVQGYQTQGYAAGTASTPSTITFGGSGAIALTDTLSTGSVVVGNGSSTITFQMANAGGSTVVAGGHTTISTANLTLGSLVTAIDNSSLGITAAIGTGANDTNLVLTSSTNGSQITAAPSGGASILTDNFATQITNPTSGSGTQHESSVLDPVNGANMFTVGANGKLAGTLVLTNVVGGTTITDSFVMNSLGVLNQAGGAGDTGNVWDLSAANSTLAGLKAAINDAGTETGFQVSGKSLDINASTDGATGGIFLQALDTGGTGSDTGLYTGAGNNLTFNAAAAATATTAGHVAGPASLVIANTGTNQLSDPLAGSIVLFNSALGQQTTFTMGGATGSNTSPVGLGTQNITVTGNSLGALATAISNAGLGLTATLNTGAVPGLNISAAPGTTGTLTASSSLTDVYVGTAAGTGGQAATDATNGSATVGTSVANLTGASVLGLGQSIVLTNNGVVDTFTMGTSAGSPSQYAFTTGGLTMQDLATAISNANNLNLSATVSNGVLNLASTVADSTLAVGSGSNDTLTATVTENPNESTTIGTAPGAGTPAYAGRGSNATFTLAGGGSVTSINSANDVVTGSIAIAANGVNGGNKVTFTMGATAAQVAMDNQLNAGYNASQVYIAGNQLSSLEAAIGTDLGVTVGTNGSSLTLTSQTPNTIAITSSGSLNEFGVAPAQSSATLGTFNSDSDMVAGTISLTDGNGAQSYSFAGETVHELITAINDGDTTGLTGVTASYSNPGGFGTLTLTSNTYGSAGDLTAYSNTNITDETPVATLTYAQTSGYNVGISNSNAQSTALYDTSSGQANPTTNAPNSSFLSETSGGSGIATMSYSDGAGVSLSASDLSNQTDAESALTNLNHAITDVAAQDGYIGAQINTLNSVSSVLSTQQENVTSAQNAVQATDYAMATSNMSKYEILSQTGIAALAQANSIQQEVTKLLQ